ncbi:gamma-glutamyltransferase family protein [Nisaea sp.]|uniref:gamma-glutamyltransferase family protein n=1 Tax=Nisaea sp. TaxID=2024842 RepID=UPI003B51CCD5
MSVAVYSHGRPTVRAVGGMVSSAHPLASAAGAKMLESGGNAFDAIVASAAVLNVAEPFMSGLAGLGCATVFTAPDRKVRVLDFHPPVPAAFDPDGLDCLDIRDGANASGTPGNLAGWCTLASELGTLPLGTLLAPAIRHARQGIPVSPFFVDMVRVSRPRAMQPEWRSTYIDPTGDASLGAVLKQPDLAETLEAITAEGPSYLYDGPLGRKMIQHLKALGGCMTEDDLAAVAPVWEAPVVTSYRGLDIHVPPPPAESFQFLLTLKLLEGLDVGALEHLSADHLDMVFRAVRLAAETRIRNNKCGPERVAELLDERHAAPLRDRLLDPAPITGRTEQFGDGPLPGSVELREHTTSLSAVDRDGNAVCLTQSLGSMFGSGVVIPGTGVTMNNFMNWGDLHPDSPNRLIGGKRFGMCLAPSISLRDGDAVLALGTPGSYGILQTQAQAMVHHLDFGLDLQAAIDAPRARLWDGARVDLEARVEAPVIEELKRRGHAIEMTTPFAMQCGGMHAIRRDPESGALFGAADSRRDGAAVAI